MAASKHSLKKNHSFRIILHNAVLLHWFLNAYTRVVRLVAFKEACLNHTVLTTNNKTVDAVYLSNRIGMINTAVGELADLMFLGFVGGMVGIDGMVGMKIRRIHVTLIRVAAAVDKFGMEGGVSCLCAQPASRKVTEPKPPVNAALFLSSQCAILFHPVKAKAATMMGVVCGKGRVVTAHLVSYITTT